MNGGIVIDDSLLHEVAEAVEVDVLAVDRRPCGRRRARRSCAAGSPTALMTNGGRVDPALEDEGVAHAPHGGGRDDPLVHDLHGRGPSPPQRVHHCLHVLLVYDEIVGRRVPGTILTDAAPRRVIEGHPQARTHHRGEAGLRGQGERCASGPRPARRSSPARRRGRPPAAAGRPPWPPARRPAAPDRATRSRRLDRAPPAQVGAPGRRGAGGEQDPGEHEHEPGDQVRDVAAGARARLGAGASGGAPARPRGGPALPPSRPCSLRYDVSEQSPAST